MTIIQHAPDGSAKVPHFADAMEQNMEDSKSEYFLCLFNLGDNFKPLSRQKKKPTPSPLAPLSLLLFFMFYQA